MYWQHVLFIDFYLSHGSDNGIKLRFVSTRGKPCLVCKKIIFETENVKTNKMTCAPSTDSAQPGHPSSLISLFTVLFMGSEGSKPSSVSDHTWWMPRLISLRWAHRSFSWFCYSSFDKYMYI